jgi:hypothetical protein
MVPGRVAGAFDGSPDGPVKWLAAENFDNDISSGCAPTRA